MGLNFIHKQHIVGDHVGRESNFNALVIGLCYKMTICVIPRLEVGESVVILKGPQGRINIVVWGPLKKTIIMLPLSLQIIFSLIINKVNVDLK